MDASFRPAFWLGAKAGRSGQRYILTAFTFGCNLGPAQAARHLQGLATAHELSFTNRRHVSVDQLDAVIKRVVNAYHRCDLPEVWGSASSASADGTKYDLAENSLLAEYSIRYGSYGAIAYWPSLSAAQRLSGRAVGTMTPARLRVRDG